jgi:hypothetical protein
MPVIAAHPEVHPVPSAILFGVGSDLSHCLIDYSHRVAHDGRVVTRSVGSLVDTRERDERELHSLLSQSPRDLFTDLAIDREPSLHIAAKVCCCRARDERSTLADTVSPAQSARDHAQRTHAWLGQLENRGRCLIDVAVYEPHLRSDVAASMS